MQKKSDSKNVLPPTPSPKPNVSIAPGYNVPFGPIFEAAEKAFGIPNLLLVEMARKESNFNTKAISNKGAVGIMQIVPKWHPGVNPLDPSQSIMYAAKYLKSLYQQTGSWRGALAAYNWGIGNLNNYGFDKMPMETRDYIAVITNRLPYYLG